MLKFLLNRIFISIITLIVISYFAFGLSSYINTDPVEQLLARSGFYMEEQGLSEYRKEYERVSLELGKNLAPFYFKITPRNHPSYFSSALFQQEKESLIKALNSGYSYESLVDDNGIYMEERNRQSFGSRLWWVPRFHWFGTDNQYHRWISSALVFDFGTSIMDGRPVEEHVFEALPWTIFMGLIALIISAAISIPLGSYVASFRNQKREDRVATILYGLHSIPVFWLATILVVFFTTNEYGTWTNWFPSVGIRPSPASSTWSRILQSLGHLILPVFCLVIHSVAFDIIQIKGSVKRQLLQDYVMTSRAKGVKSFTLFLRHILRNALVPMITILVIGIPVMISGSIVVETIFNIPGMGRLLLESLYQGDWNIVMAIVLLSSVITTISFLIGDILYVWANPKIKLSI